MNDRCPTCPAASPLAGPEAKGPSVICRIMAEEDKAADAILEGMFHGTVVTAGDDPSTFYGFCHGQALPMISIDELAEPRGHYTFCPVWLDAWEAEQESKQRVYDDLPPTPNVIGSDTNRPTLADEDALDTLAEF